MQSEARGATSGTTPNELSCIRKHASPLVTSCDKEAYRDLHSGVPGVTAMCAVELSKVFLVVRRVTIERVNFVRSWARRFRHVVQRGCKNRDIEAIRVIGDDFSPIPIDGVDASEQEYTTKRVRGGDDLEGIIWLQYNDLAAVSPCDRGMIS